MGTTSQTTVVGRLIQSKILIVLIVLAPQPALACKKFSIWHYPYKQRCLTALAYVKPASRVPETFQQRIDIPVPALLFEPAPEGDERLQGIAKLHALIDAR